MTYLDYCIQIKLKALCLLYIVLFSVATSFANNHSVDLSVQNINFSVDGLPSKSIQSIKQDKKGFLWIATNNGVTQYDGYTFKNFFYEPDNPNSLTDNFTKQIHIDNEDRIWVSTRRKGLNLFNNSGFIQYLNQPDDYSSISSNIVNSLESTSDGLWIASDNGLNFLANNQNTFERIQLLDELKDSPEKVHLIFALNDSKLIINVNEKLVLFDTKNRSGQVIKATPKNEAQRFRFHSIVKHNNEIWAATDQGLYLLNENKTSFFAKNIFPKNTITISLLSDSQNGLMIGTFQKGLYRFDNNDALRKLNFLINNEIYENDSIFSIFKDNHARLWLGTFYNGLISFTANTTNISIYQTVETSCKKKLSITAINNIDNSIYLGSNNGFFVIDKINSTCKNIISGLSDNSIASLSIQSVSQLNPNTLAVNTANGTLLFDILTQQFISDLKIGAHNTFFFINDQGSYIQGTKSGLFRFAGLNSNAVLVETSKDIVNPGYIAYTKTNEDKYIFATTKGLLALRENKVEKFNQHEQILNGQINSVYADKYIWVGKRDGTLLKLNHKGELYKSYSLDSNSRSLVIYNILGSKTEPQELWISTNQGLYKFNTNTEKSNVFTKKDGLISNDYIRGAASSSDNGVLLFGSSNGFVSFMPNELKPNKNPPKVALTKMTHFNKEVRTGISYDGFTIKQPIQSLKNLSLTHKDYILGFEFAGLHFSDPSRNQYAYKLDGFHKDWIFTDAKNRSATFTNLNPGDYVFRVKAANKDGVWSKAEDNVALNITVHPAPWFSWWAYTIYALLFLIGLYTFIRYRTNAANQRAKLLEEEVKQRTQEINTQKTTIEQLLQRKDELFANISHEFRTPLTLILGPLEKQLSQLSPSDNPKNLLMIQRNANRLLTMVEQILKLASLKNVESDKKMVYAVDKAIPAIVDSFQALAESKDIFLKIKTNESVNTMVFPDALDVMIGNLISNAIKYTPNGGNVSIESRINNDEIHISICDTGIGLSEQQQKDIFDRFVRLDQTSDIAGTGIGLSIVSELVHKHDGSINVSSLAREGSCFTIHLPITKQKATTDRYAVRSIEHLIQTQSPNDDKENIEDLKNVKNENREHILIIDDNDDMRDYIEQVLSDDFECVTANRGARGLELARSSIPDLIICDIMMPEMNGYEVTRELRNDITTSHIPLILLTAKGDKQSRILGWNENIDDFMTKPFDEGELHSRVHNLISVRKMLSRRVASQLTIDAEIKNVSAASASATDITTTANVNELEIATINHTTDAEPVEKLLNKKEQAFLDKFIATVKDNYSDIFFQKQDFIQHMHVSERQLHRKIKALADKTPMEILKEYRLKMATQFLLDGESVTKTLELCGFNSASNFSRSFKAMYGVSPKQYQLNAKKE